MTSKDLTPEEWKQFETGVMQHWRAAFTLAQHVVDADYPMNDPMYHYCGALLAATCDLRRLAAAGIEGRKLPKVAITRSMMMFVMPQTGGGCVPHKR